MTLFINPRATELSAKAPFAHLNPVTLTCPSRRRPNLKYSDEEAKSVAADDLGVRAENLYYGHKEHVASGDLETARAGFASVIDLEASSSGDDLLKISEWAFKSMKQLIKMDFRAGSYSDMLEKYKCVREAVHRLRRASRRRPLRLSPPFPESSSRASRRRACRSTLLRSQSTRF